jgi:hypothetical protein
VEVQLQEVDVQLGDGGLGAPVQRNTNNDFSTRVYSRIGAAFLGGECDDLKKWCILLSYAS